MLQLTAVFLTNGNFGSNVYFAAVSLLASRVKMFIQLSENYMNRKLYHCYVNKVIIYYFAAQIVLYQLLFQSLFIYSYYFSILMFICFVKFRGCQVCFFYTLLINIYIVLSLKLLKISVLL